VRDVVVFALHNINKDAPFIKLDLLVCRNLLIYLSGELQKSLLPVFHYALNPKALLFLGPSENITGYQDLFRPLDVKWKISRRTAGAAALPHLIRFPFAMARHPTAAPPTTTLLSPSGTTHRQNGSFAALVQKNLLQAYAPPAVVIDPRGEILFVNGRTGKYPEPAPGLSGMNLFEMARAELNFELSGAVHRVAQSREPVVVDDVRVRTDTGQQLLRLTVRPLTEPEPLMGLLLVVFEDQPTPRRVRQAKRDPAAEGRHRDGMVAALDKELHYTRHRLQTTVEEMESSLKELKSTNEEAMTNKEEMQSLNEELMTLNMQYLAKTEELSQRANDMKNLLDATEIAIIFLDNDLIIKRFTPPVGRIISLLPSDVGRPLAHFTSSLRHEHLLRDGRQVLVAPHQPRNQHSDREGRLVYDACAALPLARQLHQWRGYHLHQHHAPQGPGGPFAGSRPLQRQPGRQRARAAAGPRCRAAGVQRQPRLCRGFSGKGGRPAEPAAGRAGPRRLEPARPAPATMGAARPGYPHP